MAARKRRNGMNARPKVEAQSNNIIRPYSDAGSRDLLVYAVPSTAKHATTLSHVLIKLVTGQSSSEPHRDSFDHSKRLGVCASGRITTTFLQSRPSNRGWHMHWCTRQSLLTRRDV